MQWISITTIHILTMFVYCIESDHTDGTIAIQHATKNVDLCTHFAFLLLCSRTKRGSTIADIQHFLLCLYIFVLAGQNYFRSFIR